MELGPATWTGGPRERRRRPGPRGGSGDAAGLRARGEAAREGDGGLLTGPWRGRERGVARRGGREQNGGGGATRRRRWRGGFG